MKYIILSALIFSVFSCSEEKTTTPSSEIDMTKLIGRWRYDEVQATPQPKLSEVLLAQGKIIEFKQDGSYTLVVENYSPEGEFFVQGQTIIMDGGFFDGQTKEVNELTNTRFRAKMSIISDDGKSPQVIGSATFTLSRVLN